MFELAAGSHSLTGLAVQSLDGGGAAFLEVVPSGVSAAPEPGTWALMLGGVGAMGMMLRRRRRAGATFAA